MNKIFFPMKSTPLAGAAKNIILTIRKNGGNAYFVGGSVRNMLMHRDASDIDIVCDLPIEKILNIFPDALQTGAAFGITIIKEQGFSFELASAREERFYMDGRHPESIKYTTDFEVDSQRRDFTVNAMLYDPETENIIDFHNGAEDLKKGILRTVGDSSTRFKEDYLRMLRAVRFAAAYDLEIEPATFEGIVKNSALTAQISHERILQELDLMFGSAKAAKAVELLHQCNILKHILPEVTDLIGLEQPPAFHPEGDVFTHTMQMLHHMAYPSSDLTWSVLLHDCGKKKCFFKDHKGIHFYGHECAGAVVAEQICDRMRMSNQRKKLITTMVRDHMRFVQVSNMKKSTIRKFLGREDIAMLMEINRLDNAGSAGDFKDWLFMLEKFAEYQDTDILPPPLITGKILRELGYKPGPQFSKILNFIYEKQLSDKKIDFERACDLIKERFPCIL